jgi:hypothetical protein
MLQELLSEYLDRVPIEMRADAEIGFSWQFQQTAHVMGSEGLVISSTHNPVFPEYAIVKLRRREGVPSIFAKDFVTPVNDASLRLAELSLNKMANLAFGQTGKLKQNARMAFELVSSAIDRTIHKHIPCKQLQILTRWNTNLERDALHVFDGSLLPDIDRLSAKHVRAAERFTKAA